MLGFSWSFILKTVDMELTVAGTRLYESWSAAYSEMELERSRYEADGAITLSPSVVECDD